MKIKVNSEACAGYGTCADVFPEVIVLDEWGYADVINGGEVPAHLEEAARKAVYDCPIDALSLDDEESN